MVELLSPITKNSYTVNDSFSFAEEIVKVPNNNYVMASFDVKSLFTNIPIVETCEIILAKLFPETDSMHLGFNKTQFRNMLNNCTQNNLFLFNGTPYLQLDGCPMGGCISPTLANIFLCYHEELWLNSCPPDFKPVVYRRYVDDTFLLFREHSHIQLFFDFLNKQHERIQFTFETEKQNSLSFLDVLVNKVDDHFETSSYRKPTSTGLGLQYNSATPSIYKFNLINCLIDRAYKINSTYKNLCTEFQYLRKFFSQNGYKLDMINECISKKLNSIYEPTPPVTTVPKQILYCKVPYMSSFFNKQLNSEISNLVSKFYPQINLRIIFNNVRTIESLFRYKDEIPTPVRSNIVYKYTCGICDSTYLGETTRHFKTRVAEHRGISSRTGMPLVSANRSNVFSHFLKTGHEVLPNYFSIVQSTKDYELKTAESITILKLKPNLNEMVSSKPLFILN